MDRLEPVLETEYGAENVTREPRFAETYREPDFLIETHLCTLAVEVENRSEDVIGGLGQAVLYASHDTEYVPVVVHPPDDENPEELGLLHGQVGVVACDVPDPGDNGDG